MRNDQEAQPAIPRENACVQADPFTPAISDPSPLHFTGKPRDAETGLDDFGARYNSSSLGRFLTPDDGSDQDPNDPQSWNLYSYVRNNPVNNVDPDGHDCVYMNDTGNAVESIDNHSSPAECQATGGAWADGTITNVTTDPNSNNLLIQTAQLDDNGNIVYVTTETAPGQWSPGTELAQVAVGIDALRPDDFIAAAAGVSVGIGAFSGAVSYVLGGAGLTTLDLEALEIPDVQGTIHGAERMADPSRLAAPEVYETISNPTATFTQGDGAQVYVREISPGRSNVVVKNENTGRVITVLRNLSDRALARLAKNYGWR